MQNQETASMKSKILSYFQCNQVAYFENIFRLKNLALEQIEVTTKNFFKKTCNLVFIASNDFAEIQDIVEAVSTAQNIIKNTVVVFCETELSVNNDYCCYMGENGRQIVYCVYHNTVTGEYTFYTDMDTPKLVKQVIQILSK